MAELPTPELKPRVLACYKLGHCAVLFTQIYDLLRHRLGEGGQAEGRGLCPRLLTGLSAARGRLTASPLCPRRPEARAGPPAHRAAPRAAADAPAFAAQGRAQEPEASPEPRIPRLQQPEAGPCPQPPGPGLESGPERPLSEEPCGDGVPTSESQFSHPSNGQDKATAKISGVCKSSPALGRHVCPVVSTV